MHGPSSNLSPLIDVLIVDDSPDLTAMMSVLLSSEPDMRVVGVLHDAGELARTLGSLRPRVVLLDLTMPGVPPLDALRAARQTCDAQATRVIAYTGHDDPLTAAHAMAAGVWGMLSKADDPSCVIAAIRKAAADR